jgi:hypothetical protein
MNMSYSEGDDLMTIKGIGRARQQWLKESLGVRTFGDLAALSADEIETRLKAAGQVISRSEIKRWIAQAQELAADSLSQMELTGAETGEEAAFPLAQSEPSPQLAVSARAAAGEIANSPPKEGEWQPFASFVVEFQARQVEGRAAERRTTVHYMEADRSKTWPGTEGEHLCRWMLDQVGERAQRRTEPEEGRPVEARRAAGPPVTVEITQIQAFQPPKTRAPIGIGRAGQPFSGFVRSDEPFELVVSFALAGPAAPEIAKKQVTYRAQFYARRRPTGERAHLGDTEPGALVEGDLAYTTRLPQASLGPGVYRLWALVTLQSTPPSMGQFEVPLLQVV